MSPQQLRECLGHLEAAEALMVETNDFAGLTRLSLVIELLRRQHGMPDRPIDFADLQFSTSGTVEGPSQ